MSDKGSKFPTQPALIGSKIFLRPATADDVANFHFWFNQCEPQTQTCRMQILHTSGESVEAFKKRERSTSRQEFAIVRKADKTPVGHATFFDYNPLNRSAELGLLIDPDEQRQGYASEALRLLTAYLFNQRGLNKVYAQCSTDNEGTVKLLEQLGFKKDGTLRDHQFYDGEFHHCYIYSLLLFELDW